MSSRNQWKQELKAKENAPPPEIVEMDADELREYLIKRLPDLPGPQVARFAREILSCIGLPRVEIEDIQRRGKGIELRYRVTKHYF